MSLNKANEATRQLWQDKKRKERAKMRLCDDMQREIMAFHNKATYWREEHAFLRTCGRGAHNRARIEKASNSHSDWFDKALDKHHAIRRQVDKLKDITAARKKLHEQLGIDPTDDGYVDCGNRAELGKRFLLLDHELDSTASVRHYMDEHMGGSSLFANEEWRS